MNSDEILAERIQRDCKRKREKSERDLKKYQKRLKRRFPTREHFPAIAEPETCRKISLLPIEESPKIDPILAFRRRLFEKQKSRKSRSKNAGKNAVSQIPDVALAKAELAKIWK